MLVSATPASALALLGDGSSGDGHADSQYAYEQLENAVGEGEQGAVADVDADMDASDTPADEPEQVESDAGGDEADVEGGGSDDTLGGQPADAAVEGANASAPEVVASAIAAVANAALGDQEATTQALSEGSCFVSDTDEGISVTYKIISDSTVQVGAGTSGKRADVYKTDIDGKLVTEERTTISTSFNGKLTIPSTVEFQGATYTVTAVGTSAFGRYYEYMSPIDFYVNQITLPSTVTSIGDRAFEYCHLSNGVKYTTTSGLVTIGSSAFFGCYISSFELPSTVTYMGTGVFRKSRLETFAFSETGGISQIPAYTFYDSSLSSIELPSYIRTLGTRCFYKCSLGSIEIPNTLTSMETYVFQNCSALGMVKWADDTPITEIPKGTFSGCSSLRSFAFPASIASIEAESFADCGLTSIFIPKTLTYLGQSAFSDCDRATKIEFEEGHQILSIGKGVFKNCSKLTSIELPENLRDIGNDAFGGCVSLKQVRIPKLVSKIDAFAFEQCDSLDSVVFLGDADQIEFDHSAFYLSWNIKSCVFYGKRSKTISFSNSEPTVYCTISYWESRDIVGTGEPIGRYVIPVNTVPSSVDSSLAFEGSLRDAPNGYRWVLEKGYSLDGEMVDSFYAYADPIVSELHVGDTFVADTVEGVSVTYTVTGEASDGKLGVVSVGKGTGIATDTAVALDTTGAVTLASTVSGPDAHTYSVAAIQPYAFANCSRFVSITVPASVTSIGKNAFYRCAALRNVFFDSDASQIVDDGIFSGCSSIKLVVFGGKKANVAFGSSSPDVYYTVSYYATKHDIEIGNVDSRMLVHERALLESLGEGDVRSGTQPELKIGYEWKYENGFSGTMPLVDSCWVYQEGIGFQVKIRVTQGNVSETPCWFRITAFDEATGTGEVQVGLGKDGITAVSTAVRGTPVIPTTVTDEEGNVYKVTSVGDYAFGATDEVNACQGITSVNFQYATCDIATMGIGVFQNCKALAAVNLPLKLTSLGGYAFYNCIALESVNLEMLDQLGEIPEYMCYGDYKLRSLSLSSSIVNVGTRAFSHCYRRYANDYGYWQVEGLQSVNISRAKSLKSVAAYAFADNRAMTTGMGKLVFPSGFQYVGDSAFDYANVQQVTFPASTTYIGANAFRYCSNLTQIRFEGDANNMMIGSGAFFVYRNSEDPGSLSRVVFGGKKYADIESRIDSGSFVDRPNYDRGRCYSIYYTVRGYDDIASFNSGKVSRKVEVHEDSRPSDYGALGVNELYSWKVEPGFSYTERNSDSFYMIAGYNLSRATVSGLESSYSYTGFHIKPVPVLTWVDGRELVPGVDYEFDVSKGSQGDGYVNNRTMGKATIYLKGVGDFAGTKTATFQIEGTYDTDAAFSNVSLAPSVFTYDGTAHEPAVQVSGTVKDREFNAEEGVDYTITYENNVNASTVLRTAYVVVHGMGMFSSEKRVPFLVMPLNVNKCSIAEATGTYDALTLKMTLNLKVVSPWGAQLVEGTDYKVSYANSSAVGKATVFITGIGNYTGVLTQEVETGGGYGGGGGGKGHGQGTGPGNEDGKGNNDVNGTGSSSRVNSDATTTSDLATGTFGGDLDPSVAGRAGSAAGGSSYSLFALGTDADIVVNIPAIVPYLWLILLLVGLVVAGVCYRSADFRRQASAPGAGGGAPGAGSGPGAGDGAGAMPSYRQK